MAESDIDDGGSHDQIAQETRRLLSGNTETPPEEIKNLLSFRVLQAFVNQLPEDHKKFGRIKKETQESSIKKTSSFNFDDNQKKIKKKKKKTPLIRGGIISFEDKGLEPPRLSSKLEKRIINKRGTDIKIVIVKHMYTTDLSQHHDRLSIPLIQIRDITFLTEEERKVLSDESGKLRVKLMEPCKVVSKMVLKKWKLNSTYSYALRTSWNAVLQRNHVNEKYFGVRDVIQLWSFRVDGQLWFAIDKVWDHKTSSRV